MAFTPLTPEQRAQALAASNAARRERADIKSQLKSGAVNLKQVLKDAETNQAIARMKVTELLRAMPRMGKGRVEELMDSLGVDPGRRLRGLGPRQRELLLEKFDLS